MAKEQIAVAELVLNMIHQRYRDGGICRYRKEIRLL